MRPCVTDTELILGAIRDAGPTNAWTWVCSCAAQSRRAIDASRREDILPLLKYEDTMKTPEFSGGCGCSTFNVLLEEKCGRGGRCSKECFRWMLCHVKWEKSKLKGKVKTAEPRINPRRRRRRSNKIFQIFCGWRQPFVGDGDAHQNTNPTRIQLSLQYC